MVTYIVLKVIILSVDKDIRMIVYDHLIVTIIISRKVFATLCHYQYKLHNFSVTADATLCKLNYCCWCFYVCHSVIDNILM